MKRTAIGTVLSIVLVTAMLLSMPLAMAPPPGGKCTPWPSCKDDGDGDPPPDAANPEFAYVIRNNALKVSNRDGSHKANLYFSGSIREGPDWSPDGNSIVFADYVNGDVVLRIDVGFDANGEPVGQNLQQLTQPEDCNGGCFQPDWSPVSNDILVHAGGLPENRGRLFLVDASSGSVSPFWDEPSGQRVWYQTWSPDGSEVAFSVLTSTGGPSEVTILTLATNTTRVVASTSGVAKSLDWSNLGDRIAYSVQGRPDTVYTVDVISGNIVPVVSGTNPCWSPDDTALLINRDTGWQLRLHNLTTGETKNHMRQAWTVEWKA